MTTLYVTYAGDADTWFDRDYYVASHLPLVRRAFGPHGLVSAAAFFPAKDAAGDGSGMVAVCACVFRDEAAITAAFGSPEAAAVMADVKHFTRVEPARSRAVPV